MSKILFCVALGAAACASPSDPSSWTIVNDESFAIDHIYVSAEGAWDGPDILAGVPLQAGDSVTLAAQCNEHRDIIVNTSTGTGCAADVEVACGAGDNELDLDSFFFSTCSAM